MEPVLPNLTRDAATEPVRKPVRRRAAPAPVAAAPAVERRSSIASIAGWLARLPGSGHANLNRREAWMARREARDLVAMATDRAEASADLVRRAMNRIEAGLDPAAVPPSELTALPPNAPTVHAFAGLRLPAGTDPIADYPAFSLEVRIPAAVMTPLRTPGGLPEPRPAGAARTRRAGDHRPNAPLGRELAAEPVAVVGRRLAAAPAPEADVPSTRRRAPGLPDLVAVSAKIVEAARSASARLPAPQDLMAAIVSEAEASLRRVKGAPEATLPGRAPAGVPPIPTPPQEQPAGRSLRRMRRESPFAGRELSFDMPMIPAAPTADDLPDLATLVAAAGAQSEIAVPAWVRGDERRLLLDMPGPGEAPEGAEFFRLFRQSADQLADLAGESARRPWWNLTAR